MSAEENKALARRLFAAADRKVFDERDELLAPEFQSHLSGNPEALSVDQFIGFIRIFAASFPDYTHTIEDQIAEGDRVATRITWRGTHTGEFMGLPPTGRQVSMPGLNIMRIENGKVVEQWAQFDLTTLMQQLAAAPAAV